LRLLLGSFGKQPKARSTLDLGRGMEEVASMVGQDPLGKRLRNEWP